MDALAVSGGGSKGAFAVGVLKRWMTEEQRSFDIITGTSTGALIAPLAMLGEVDELEEIYVSVRTEDIYTKRDVGDVLRSTSLTTTKPLFRLIRRHLSTERIRHLLELGAQRNQSQIVAAAAFRIQDGFMVYFHTGPQNLKMSPPRARTQLFPVRIAKNPVDCLRKAVLASCNQPALMPALNVPGEEPIAQYVDGGLRDGLPGAIAKSLGAERLWAIALSERPEDRRSHPKKLRRIFDIAGRAAGLLVDDALERSLVESTEAFGQENVTVARPDSPLTDDSNRFSPREMREMVDVGYEIASRIA